MTILRQATPTAAEDVLIRALKRAHQQYGSNLASFFEDVKRADNELIQQKPVATMPNESNSSAKS